MATSDLSETIVPEYAELLALAASGDEQAMTDLLSRYRDRLRQMINLRLDRRLYGRVDASDIVQEAVIEAARRLPDYAAKPPMEFYLWLRQLATQKLIDTHRRHLGAKKRSAGNDVSLYRGALPEASSASLAHHLLGRLTTPTTAARRAELQLKIQEALNSLDEVDREVLVLRHFEQLSNQETAQVLGLSRSAASKRYIVALARLREHLSGVPGFEEWGG
jgi:RNA polymerase sigma-70 factor (ECF subfamily)